MKRTKIICILLAGLALCQLTACDKDEPDSYGDPTANLNPINNDSLNHVNNDSIGNEGKCAIYEGHWVIDHNVVDITVLRVVDNQNMEIVHMPNQVLLTNVLSDEQKELPIIDANKLVFRFENIGYNSLFSYMGTSSTMTFSNPTDDAGVGLGYMVQIGDEKYVIDLDGQIEGMYEEGADSWVLKWTIRRVRFHHAESASSESKDYIFDPALIMLLVSTKRLDYMLVVSTKQLD